MMFETRTQTEERLKRDWFSKHVANPTVPGEAGGAQIIMWTEPDTSFYKVRYMLCESILYVVGDIGAATYIFNATMEWKDFLPLYSDYFASKCVASEYGKGYKSWWADLAFHRLQAWINEEDDADERAKRALDLDSVGEFGDTGIRACQDKTSWQFWLAEFGDDTFGDDYAEEFWNFGDDVNVRCIGHLVGLKMAIEQLQKEKRL